jgi:hypothetical protein
MMAFLTVAFSDTEIIHRIQTERSIALTFDGRFVVSIRMGLDMPFPFCRTLNKNLLQMFEFEDLLEEIRIEFLP